MIVIDSGVWIDYFNGISNAETALLNRALESPDILVGDLILCEVLQGFRAARDFHVARSLLAGFPFAEMAGYAIAIRAAENYRRLRALGITVRKTIDLLVGTFCIEGGHNLLHKDRDFAPMAAHLGLQIVR